MTLTQLKYMIAVAETGNFTSASKKVFVTQPSLSMQIQKLEEELGVQIFNRNKKYHKMFCFYIFTPKAMQVRT